MLLPRQQAKLARGAKHKEHAMSTVIAVIGIDIGKNTFYVVGHDARDAIPRSPYSARHFPLIRASVLTLSP